MTLSVDALRQLVERGEFAAAARACATELDACPEHGGIWNVLGMARSGLGDADGAVAAFRRAVELTPRDEGRQINLGIALLRSGQATCAVAALRGALARCGESAALLHELGNAHRAADAHADAIGAYRASLRLRPGHTATSNNLGAALVDATEYDAAIEVLSEVIARAPGYVRPRVNLGKALRQVGRLREAVAALESALALDARHLPALVNLADALAAGGQRERAAVLLDTALRAAPSHAAALGARGMLRFRGGDAAGGIADLRRATELDPRSAELRGMFGHVLFASGEWSEAWPQLEARWLATLRATPWLPAEGRWDGDLAATRKLMLVSEQGLGDTLQFLRYGAALRERGIRTTLVCAPALHRLARESGLVDEVCDFDTAARYQTAPWCPLMSIAHHLGTTRDTVPGGEGYLSADADRVRRWAATLGSPGRRRIGIAWQGNPRAEMGAFLGRSPGLAAFAPLLNGLDASVYSLQKGPGAEALETLAVGTEVRRLEGLDAGPDAFLDTAAVMANLDLVITGDTAVAHLAGALGRPVWIALPANPDWRWMRDATATPWYRSARLFRQATPGDWRAVFGAMRAVLDSDAR